MGLPEVRKCLPSDYGSLKTRLFEPSDSPSLRQGSVSPQIPGPQESTVSPLLCLLKDTALFLLRIGLFEEELCLPSDWCRIHWIGGQREVWVADAQK